MNIWIVLGIIAVCMVITYFIVAGFSSNDLRWLENVLRKKHKPKS